MSLHGTYSRYSNGGCRCDECRSANTAYVRRRNAERHAYVAAHGLPSTVEHGCSAYQNWGCKCAVCLGAWAAYMRSYEERRRTARRPT